MTTVQLPEQITRRITITAAGCWEWQGAHNGIGYGQLSYQGRKWYVHRLAYTIAHGPIPPGLYVMHACDNPPCCNPEHLATGTQLDNMRESLARGRYGGERARRTGAEHWSHATPELRIRGEDHGCAKLTTEDVVAIRAAVSAGESQRSVSRRYGVSRPQIRRIVAGTAWAHVPLS